MGGREGSDERGAAIKKTVSFRMVLRSQFSNNVTKTQSNSYTTACLVTTSAWPGLGRVTRPECLKAVKGKVKSSGGSRPQLRGRPYTVLLF